MIPLPPRATLSPYTTLFRSITEGSPTAAAAPASDEAALPVDAQATTDALRSSARATPTALARSLNEAVGFRPDRKSTRLNSSHLGISYAVFCLKQKHSSRYK